MRNFSQIGPFLKSSACPKFNCPKKPRFGAKALDHAPKTKNVNFEKRKKNTPKWIKCAKFQSIGPFL